MGEQDSQDRGAFILPNEESNRSCEQCARLQATVEKLQAELAALKAELRRGKRQAAPFSKGKGKAEKKKPGRRRGKGHFTRRAKPEVKPTDKVEEIAVNLEDTR